MLELLDCLKNNFGREKHKELSDKLVQCMMLASSPGPISQFFNVAR